jgi:hypothetical protein
MGGYPCGRGFPDQMFKMRQGAFAAAPKIREISQSSSAAGYRRQHKKLDFLKAIIDISVTSDVFFLFFLIPLPFTVRCAIILESKILTFHPALL